MFEELLPKGTKTLLKKIAPIISQQDFYLGSGSELALQLGHRISRDLDFFRELSFEPQPLLSALKEKTPKCKEIMIERSTLVCELQKVKIAFFQYGVPLIFECKSIFQIRVADWKDIVAEKFKTIAQQGSRKDFYDLYFVLSKNKLSIKEAIKIFKQRFKATPINFYHVLKSITYFEEASHEPEVKII